MSRDWCSVLVLLLLLVVVSMMSSDLGMVMVLMMIMLLLLLLRLGVHLLRLLTLMLMLLLLLLLLLVMKGQLLLLVRHQERVERVEIVGGVVLHIITGNYKEGEGKIDGGRGQMGWALIRNDESTPRTISGGNK
jgi:cell division protein FtsW (lipid II flippase)